VWSQFLRVPARDRLAEAHRLEEGRDAAELEAEGGRDRRAVDQRRGGDEALWRVSPERQKDD
jgi:hypothetical protein